MFIPDSVQTTEVTVVLISVHEYIRVQAWEAGDNWTIKDINEKIRDSYKSNVGSFDGLGMGYELLVL
jgi:hypothetical protein